MINGNACFAYFNKNWGIPSQLGERLLTPRPISAGPGQRPAAHSNLRGWR
jgi:hypothetical protein